MSANNFENNVQQKLGELRLKPTEEVWVEVEHRIREKKRRRIIFWFLLPGLLVLGGGGWWMINQPNGKNDMTVTQSSENNKTGTEEKIKKDNTEKNETGENKVEIKNTERSKKIELSVNTKSNTTKENPKESKINESTIRQEILPANRKTIEKKQGTIAEILKQLPVIKTDVEGNVQIIDPMPATKTKEPVKSGDINTQEANNLSEKKIEDKNIITDTLVTAKAEEKKLPETKNIASVELITENLPKTDSAATAATPKNKQKKAKWQIGVTGNIGTSRLTDKGLIGSGLKSADLLFSTNGSSTGQMRNSSYADSITLKGLTWQLGVFAQRNTGKKLTYSVGLGFSYYSTNQNVGTFVDSVKSLNNDARSVTTGGFYRSGSFNNYRNKYYYIQVPLFLYWQMNKGKKLPPLIWENGFSPSFMISNKALAYDKSAHLFFRDKQLYNKFSLVYHTGFDVKLFANKKHPLTAGLFYDFHFSRLQKISPPNYNYLKSFGVKINYLIKK